MTNPLPEPEAEAPEDAYSLLSRPTLTLSDAQLLLIVENLRARRKSYMEGKPDRPDKAAAKPKTTSEKAAATAAILAELEFKL